MSYTSRTAVYQYQTLILMQDIISHIINQGTLKLLPFLRVLTIITNRFTCLPVCCCPYFRLAQYDEDTTFLATFMLCNFPIYLICPYMHQRVEILENLMKPQRFSKRHRINSNDIYLKNNYSNLLIDLGRLSEAKKILTDIISSNPDYEDAKANLHRLESQLLLSKHTIFSITKQLAESVDSLNDVDYSFYDPLLFAFSKEEVERTAPLDQHLGIIQNLY